MTKYFAMVCLIVFASLVITIGIYWFVTFMFDITFKWKTAVFIWVIFWILCFILGGGK